VSNRLMWRRRSNGWNERARPAWNRKKARIKYVISATPMWVMTAFSEVPEKVLIFRCCLMALKNNAIYHRSVSIAAIVVAARGKALVQNTSCVPVSGCRYPTRRSMVGEAVPFGPNRTTW
jgi:hypothetical protein